MGKTGLEDRVIIITGAASGMGHEASKLIIEEGGLVVAADVQSLEETRRAIEAELGGASFDERALLVKCDVSDEAQVENVCQAGLRHFGRIDGCIINAGVSTAWIPWIECPASHVENNFRVNCLGAWLTAKHAVRAMIASPHGGQGGALVWVSSVASLYGEPGVSPYTAAKTSILGLNRTAAQEFGKYGIRSNVIQPGATRTPMILTSGLSEAEWQELEKTNVLKRSAHPRELAQVMAFYLRISHHLLLQPVGAKAVDVWGLWHPTFTMLEGKVVILTGAASGIGLAAAQLFVEQGARIVATDIQSLEPTRKAIEKLLSNGQVVEDKALLVQGDVTDEASVANVCQAGLRHFGKIDGAVLNAGMCPAMVPWLDCPAEQIEQTNRVNVLGPWLTAKHAVKAMIASPHGGKGCALVFVASVASTYGEPMLSPYTASKWGVRGLSLTAAQEFAQYGVRANCIQPGATRTPMVTVFGDEGLKAVERTNTMKRSADPREIAEVMAFYVSDRSSFCNGSTIAVHAGQTPT